MCYREYGPDDFQSSTYLVSTCLQRNVYNGAQQPLMGNFFPQQSPGNLGVQGMFPLDAQDHQAQGMFRQPPGMPGPQGELIQSLMPI